MFNDIDRIKFDFERTLPALHTEILQSIGIAISELENRSSLAWKALIDAQGISLISLSVFVTRQRRDDFYFRHETIIEHLLSTYAEKIPSHLRYMLGSSGKVPTKLTAVYPIVLYESTLFYFVHGEQELCLLH